MAKTIVIQIQVSADDWHSTDDDAVAAVLTAIAPALDEGPIDGITYEVK